MVKFKSIKDIKRKRSKCPVDQVQTMWFLSIKASDKLCPAQISLK